jgi:hypothetical protein
MVPSRNPGRILSDTLTGGNFGKLNHKAHSSWKYKLGTMKVATRNSLPKVFQKDTRKVPEEVGT